MTETKALSLSSDVLTVQLLSSFEPNRVAAAVLQQYKRESPKTVVYTSCQCQYDIVSLPTRRSFLCVLTVLILLYQHSVLFFTRTARWQQWQSYKNLTNSDKVQNEGFELLMNERSVKSFFGRTTVAHNRFATERHTHTHTNVLFCNLLLLTSSYTENLYVSS